MKQSVPETSVKITSPLYTHIILMKIRVSLIYEWITAFARARLLPTGLTTLKQKSNDEKKAGSPLLKA